MEPNLASDVAQKVAWTSAPLMTNSQLYDAKSFILLEFCFRKHLDIILVWLRIFNNLKSHFLKILINRIEK